MDSKEYEIEKAKQYMLDKLSLTINLSDTSKDIINCLKTKNSGII